MSNRSRRTRHFQHEHLCHKLGSHLSREYVTYLFLLLATPTVGIQPEELLLTLLVSHGLLAARRGAAHEARHGGALGLDRAIGPTVGLPHWVGRHVYCLTTSLSQSSLHQSSLHTRKPFVLPPPAARCSTRGGALRHGRAPPSAWVRALAGTDSGLVVGHNRPLWASGGRQLRRSPAVAGRAVTPGPHCPFPGQQGVGTTTTGQRRRTDALVTAPNV